MCSLCVDAVVQAQYGVDMEEERTEEVSLFIAAEAVTISCLLWGRWRSGLEIPITAQHVLCSLVPLASVYLCPLRPDEIREGQSLCGLTLVSSPDPSPEKRKEGLVF